MKTRQLKSTAKLSLFGAAASFAATPAFAHVGNMAHSHDMAFAQGVMHPITGMDHLLMLLGFGIFLSLAAAQNKDTDRKQAAKFQLSWAMMALASLVAGLGFGATFGAINGVELAISASMFVVAAGIWFSFSNTKLFSNLKLSTGLGMASVALVFFHGYAHGVEATGSLVEFGLGMLVGASVLMLAGRSLGQLIASRWLGGVIAASAFLTLAA